MKYVVTSLSYRCCAICIVSFAFFACSRKAGVITDSTLPFAEQMRVLDAGTPLMQLSYELETTTRYTHSSTNTMDLVVAVPMVERQKVTMKLFDDGTTEWVIEEQTPEFPLEVQHETPRNDIPKPRKTVIAREQMLLYSFHGEFLGSSEMQMPPMTALADSIKKLGNRYSDAALAEVFSSFQGGETATQWAQLIAQAPQYGITVHELDNGIISMHIPANALGQGEGMESTHLWDRVHNLPLGNTTYDAQGRESSSIYFRYTPNGAGFRMAGFFQRAPSALPSGAQGVQETEASISNFSCTFNL